MDWIHRTVFLCSPRPVSLEIETTTYKNTNRVKSRSFLPLHVGKRSNKATNFSSHKSTPTPNVQCLTKLHSSQCSETHGNCKTSDPSKNHHQGVTAKAVPSSPLENLLILIYWKIFSWPSNLQPPKTSQVKTKLLLQTLSSTPLSLLFCHHLLEQGNLYTDSCICVSVTRVTVVYRHFLSSLTKWLHQNEQELNYMNMHISTCTQNWISKRNGGVQEPPVDLDNLIKGFIN